MVSRFSPDWWWAAAHVVADPLANGDPWLDAALDWDATLAYRRHLWDLGFSVAEAMLQDYHGQTGQRKPRAAETLLYVDVRQLRPAGVGVAHVRIEPVHDDPDRLVRLHVVHAVVLSPRVHVVRRRLRRTRSSVSV